MSQKKYASLTTLQTFLENLRNTFAGLVHKHTISDITDYKVDEALSPTSTNPVANNVLDAEFDAISDALGALELAIDGKSDSSHSHDDLYYTESEIDSKFSSYETKTDASAKLTEAKTYTDDAVSQKSQVQIITWEDDD